MNNNNYYNKYIKYKLKYIKLLNETKHLLNKTKYNSLPSLPEETEELFNHTDEFEYQKIENLNELHLSESTYDITN